MRNEINERPQQQQQVEQHGKLCGTQAIKNGGKGSQGQTHTHVANEISKLAKMKWKSKAVNANKRRRIYSWVFFAGANLFLLT